MARYMIEASYTSEGAKGLIKDGGTKRRAAVAKLAESLGGRVETFYYAFGARDLVCIVELPNNVAAAAAALVPASTGAAKVRTTVLLTPEEIDQAVKQSVSYVPPGQ